MYSLPKILIVEDDPIAHIIIKNIFKQFDCELHIVESAEAALEEQEKHTYNLAFVDIGLPGDIDGITLIEIIRRTEKGRELGIIALTAHVHEMELDRLQRAKPNKLVIKPLEWSTLLEIMAEFVPECTTRTRLPTTND